MVSENICGKWVSDSDPQGPVSERCRLVKGHAGACQGLTVNVEPEGKLPRTQDEAIADDLHDILNETGKHVLILNTTAESLELLAENEEETARTLNGTERQDHLRRAKRLRRLSQAIEAATKDFGES